MGCIAALKIWSGRKGGRKSKTKNLRKDDQEHTSGRTRARELGEFCIYLRAGQRGWGMGGWGKGGCVVWLCGAFLSAGVSGGGGNTSARS